MNDTDYLLLCLACRATSLANLSVLGCPHCGDTGVPADVRDKATITLTVHEWRCLFIWASNHASAYPDTKMKQVVDGIVQAVREQCPTMPPLTMAEEFQQVADKFGAEVEVHEPGGKEYKIKPEKKH